jgi:DNA primase
MQSSSPQVHPSVQWLKDHHISKEIAIEVGITLTRDRVSIPVRDRAGNILFRKHRLFGGTAKYLYEKGATANLFGQEQLDKHFTVVIAEGEADAMALRSLGIFAVSSTGGAGTFRAEWAEMLKGKEVFICYDRDNAGAHGMLRVLRYIPGAYLVMLPPFKDATGKDVCDYLTTHTIEDFKQLLRDALLLPLPDDSRKTYKAKQYRTLLRDLNAIRSTSNHFYIDYWVKLFIAELHDLEKPNWVTHHSAKGTDDLSRVRAYPIEQFVKFDARGAALCVFHKEKSPSMHLNGARTQMPNTVKCYSCGKFGGVIDVVMSINSCTFAEAVKLIKARI